MFEFMNFRYKNLIDCHISASHVHTHPRMMYSTVSLDFIRTGRTNSSIIDTNKLIDKEVNEMRVDVSLEVDIRNNKTGTEKMATHHDSTIATIVNIERQETKTPVVHSSSYEN